MPALPKRDAPSILFVEDDDDTTFLFQNEFEKIAPDWDLVCTREGAAAIQRLAQDPRLKAVVTDLNMPGVSGFELIKWIKGQPQFENLPVVVRSTSDDPVDKEKCFRLNIASYLEKPARLLGLRENIHHILKLCSESGYTRDSAANSAKATPKPPDVSEAN